MEDEDDSVLAENETLLKPLEKKAEGIGNQRKNQDHLDHSNINIGQNREESWIRDEICGHSETSQRPSIKAGVIIMIIIIIIETH